MPQVQILRRERAEVPDAEGRPVDGTSVTYQTQTLPPAVVVIQKPDPSDEEVLAAIKADIDARVTARPQVLDL